MKAPQNTIITTMPPGLRAGDEDVADEDRLARRRISGSRWMSWLQIRPAMPRSINAGAERHHDQHVMRLAEQGPQQEAFNARGENARAGHGQRDRDVPRQAELHHAGEDKKRADHHLIAEREIEDAARLVDQHKSHRAERVDRAPDAMPTRAELEQQREHQAASSSSCDAEIGLDHLLVAAAPRRAYPRR